MSVKVNVHVEESAAAGVVTFSVIPSHVFASLPAVASGTVSLPAWSSAEPVGGKKILFYVKSTNVTCEIQYIYI